jgi:competence ComEA-like helix-hairpin-helix protein
MSALPAATPSSPLTEDEPRIAVLALLEPAPDNETVWLAACYQLTPRVARLTPTSAALDLGPCTEQEALDVACRLADHLRWNEVAVRIGIGPTLAQRIIAEREKKPFAKVEDLKRVSGIGSKRMEQLKPLVIVGD